MIAATLNAYSPSEAIVAEMPVNHRPIVLFFCGMTLLVAQAASAAEMRYRLYVSNEKSGDVTVIDGTDLKVLATIPVGKRPRGIHVSPDARTVYVALSGTPIEPPPQLDAQGNPIFQKGKGGKDDDDDDAANADKSADGVGIIDVAKGTETGRINAGSDPEEFALSKDGTRLYVSNEDTKTASVINIASGKVEHIILAAQEPEGVATTPDGEHFFVTCEAGGDVFIVDTSNYKTSAHFKVHVRPRSVDFLPDGSVAFIPSESVGELNVIDTALGSAVKIITLPAGSRPMKVRVSADGNKVYVSTGRGGTVAVVDSHSYAVLDTIKVGTRPWGLAISPDGKFLYSANGPSNDISVVDLSTDKEIARVKAGESPWGITVVPVATAFPR
jgi:YVTN family beta-propeller protein